MSIADELLELQANATALDTVRTDIRSALVAKGVSASDHDFADFATDIASISSFPSGLQRVDYIQSSGSQWLDTGVIASQNTEFEIKLSSVTNADGATVIGNEEAYGTIKYSALIWQNNWYFNLGNAGSQGIAFASDDEYIISYKNGKFSVNNSEVSYTNTLSATPGSLALMAKKAPTSPQSDSYMKCKLHYAKIWESGTLIRDFVPCYRKSDNVIGLWDAVNGQFYTNSGSGSFTCYPSPT